jgi:phosphohistidine phosphatase
MNIYLIRHGKSEPASANKKDEDRELTGEGRKIINQSVSLWKNRISKFDFILASPLKRALQTAELIAENFNYKNDIIKDSALLPGGNTSSIIELADTIEGEDIAFIGHQPDMTHHISRLIGVSDLRIKFSPASIAKISFDGKPKKDKGILIFLLPPI